MGGLEQTAIILSDIVGNLPVYLILTVLLLYLLYILREYFLSIIYQKYSNNRT